MFRGSETSRKYSVLFGMHNRTIGPYLTANKRILIHRTHRFGIVIDKAILFEAVAAAPSIPLTKP
jgi:hypothetical protein